jgi:GT2 family glycosyltransferase
MKEAPLTALVILNYNGRKFLEQFLPGVVQYSPKESLLVVGDNASTDDSVDFLKKTYPQINCIVLDKNYGFAEGYNQVLKQVTADYYFLLNSDVELKSSWQPLIDALNINPGVVAAQPKILSYYQPDHFEHAGAAGGWMDALGYPFCIGRILNHTEEDHHQYDQSVQLFWCSGAAMIVRSKAFHDLGGFDGDYFAHMEEIDWCWRAKQCGWSVISVPMVAVYHIGGGTLPYHSENKIFLNFRNNLATLFKNEPVIPLLYKIPFRMVLDLVAAISFLFRNNIKGSKAVIKAYIQFIRWLPQLIRKRKKIKAIATGKTFNNLGLYRGSILVEYFIKGHKTFQSIRTAHE